MVGADGTAGTLIQLLAAVWGDLGHFRKRDGGISEANIVFKSSRVYKEEKDGFASRALCPAERARKKADSSTNRRPLGDPHVLLEPTPQWGNNGTGARGLGRGHERVPPSGEQALKRSLTSPTRGLPGAMSLPHRKPRTPHKRLALGCHLP